MLSSLTKSLRRVPKPDATSAERSARAITFPDYDDETPSNKRSFFRYRNYDGPRPTQYVDEDEDEDEDDEEHDDDNPEEEEGSSTSGGPEEETPLLPLFSSAHLNNLPIFALTHTFREMVVDKCDTVLSWEQLRSPQVSQFLIKPIQQEIKENHMSAAVVSALLANCLQFTKEANLHPGNSGTNRTRALICELIAIKLLREYTTRDLIDALSYDFNPLQGQSQPERQNGAHQDRRGTPRAARISCIEIAIRASSKRFLSHPLVVQHLEAIWNGSIVFHSAADSMHRKKSSVLYSYGTSGQSSLSASPQTLSNKKEVTLYNPREASLFKLSRLRVPRYRNILSTISFAVLLALFLSVLKERSLEITTLEVVFWMWAAGYMLDEVIGFNEQGFSLYIASFWNTFDLGILMLLFVHLCLRLYGVLIPPDHATQVHIAHRAYDVLAVSAILVFPRLFSVLDHYRYFSQLIIAFRMMASDMLAVFFLIIIFCSGFLVALTFAFGRDNVDDPQAVAYALLQMLLGFTPAAWDRWNDYNWMGKFVLTLFLFVCHFVVVTILITVLTNSFMEIVRNANEEHQYLFAVNTISNVKSDTLFAYVPPLNVLQWLLIPLRYVMPFREYVRVNRTIIKATHFPILFAIYLYERLVLRPRYVDTIDLVESRGRVKRILTERMPRLLGAPSIATFRQEAALEEVFRRPADTTMRTARSQERRKSGNVVSHWMQNMGDDDVEPPQEQDRKVVDKLERRRTIGSRRTMPFQARNISVSRRPTSVASDPNDFGSHIEFLSPRGRVVPTMDLTPSAIEPPSQQTDADGDDELLTNDNDDETNIAASDVRHPVIMTGRNSLRRDYFASRMASHTHSPDQYDSGSARRIPLDFQHSNSSTRPPSRRAPRPKHNRNISSATMIYNPPADSEQDEQTNEDEKPASPGRSHLDVPPSEPQTSSSKPTSIPTGGKTPKRPHDHLKSRPMLPLRDHHASRSVPDFSNLLSKSKQPGHSDDPPARARRSSLEMDLVSDIGDNKAIGGGYVGAIPASFASRMALAANATRQSHLQKEEQQRRAEDAEMFGRLMMARMNSLEEGFREVVHEVRESIKQAGSGLASRQRSPERSEGLQLPKKTREKKFRERLERPGSALGSGAASVMSNEKDMERPVTGRSGSNGTTPQNTGGPVQLPLPDFAEVRKEEAGVDSPITDKKDDSQ
ncbi:hypothetical protein H2198_006411 [Neophaeococcomyces mojaviensis]|uniref:Uncharacterized protein n=1 Tax=Neophaeococcomyces mojaviensis TaxID=3383035 RepID=A0ACC3A2X0_9EURO|nr:hypothetical protein H2198_006411 [Knufia sp. JES_112]